MLLVYTVKWFIVKCKRTWTSFILGNGKSPPFPHSTDVFKVHVPVLFEKLSAIVGGLLGGENYLSAKCCGNQA